MKRAVLATAVFFLAVSFAPDTAEAAGCRLFSRLRHRVAVSRCERVQPCAPSCIERASVDPTLPDQVSDNAAKINNLDGRLKVLEDNVGKAPAPNDPNATH